MQDSNQKPKHAGKHAAPVQEPVPAADDVFQDDYDMAGDEGEIPLRKKRRSGADAQKNNGKKKKKSKARKKKKNVKKEVLFSDKRFKHRKSLFEIMSATDEDSLFKPITIFGHQIRFWPLFVLAFIIMLIGVIVISNGNAQPVEDSVTVVGLSEDLENYQILVLSDMNGKRFGDQQGALTREVESLGYDMILCVGDMVGKDGDPEPFYEFLEGLSKPNRVYFVCGDSDPGPFVDTPRSIEGTLSQIVLEDWILGAIERGANYVDVPMAVEVGESKLWLTPTNYLNLNAYDYREEWKDQMRQEEDGVVSGLASDYNSLPFTSYRYDQAERFYEAVNTIDSSELLIGLSHIVPDDDYIMSAAMHDAESNYLFEPELIVSGHYCGGVWKLPFVGAFYVPNRMLPRYGWFPAKEDVNGLSKVGESQVYITGGLSTTSSIPLLPFRMLNDPEISVLKLTAKLPENMLDAN